MTLEVLRNRVRFIIDDLNGHVREDLSHYRQKVDTGELPHRTLHVIELAQAQQAAYRNVVKRLESALREEE